ncbi:MAG: hypothetical protein ACYDC1_17750 [Limisphaerales bacterium]
MKSALHTLYWEILWKNRFVFGALLLLLGFAAAVAWAAQNAAPEAAWLARGERFIVMAFLTSMLLGTAPFLLMESQGGWRMNSMITRWFVLPVRTGWLVLIPLLAAALFIGLLASLWAPVLNRIAPGLDYVYFIAVLVAGMAALHAVAWTVPRRPGQFWMVAALLFPVLVLLALGPQDQPGREVFRREMLLPLAIAWLGFAGFAGYAARRNRCGDWPGEVPLDRLWQWLRQGGSTSRPRGEFRSAATALYWSDSVPLLRLLTFSWLGLATLLFLWFSVQTRQDRPDLAFSPRLLAFIAQDLLPFIGLLWMAVWGIFAGCEPASGFRTRLSAYRATLPVSSGLFAGQRVLTLFLGWALIWLPSLALSCGYDPDVSGMESEDALAQMRAVITRLMTLGAQVAVGALPLLLWGRLEGFPNLLLSAIGTWAWLSILGSNLWADGEPGWRWAGLVGLLVLKFSATASTPSRHEFHVPHPGRGVQRAAARRNLRAPRIAE